MLEGIGAQLMTAQQELLKKSGAVSRYSDSKPYLECVIRNGSNWVGFLSEIEHSQENELGYVVLSSYFRYEEDQVGFSLYVCSKLRNILDSDDIVANTILNEMSKVTDDPLYIPTISRIGIRSHSIVCKGLID